MRSSRTLWMRIRHRLRVLALNRRAGIEVSRLTVIAPTASIQTDSDGHAFGGRIRVADGVTLSDGAILAAYGGSIDLRSRVYVGPYCVLYGHGGLTIGSNTMIGAHTVIVPANHGFASVDVPMNMQPQTRQGIEIGEDVWIGAHCVVLDGSRIGQGAVIGAGSVVSGEIEPYGIAVGVPAAVVRSRKSG